MLLAIDCGNTNTQFGLWDGAELCAQWRIATDWNKTADEYYVWLKTVLGAPEKFEAIDNVIICSTVPRVVFNLRVLSDQYFGCRPYVVGKEGCRLPVEVRVENQATVGPDRIANAAGGFKHYGGDLVIVDFGTATNFDVVDTDGAYIGGVIAPGVNSSLEALHHAAAALPHIDIKRPIKAIGKNTIECMQSGIYWGYHGLIEGVLARIRTEHSRAIKVIATGGLAPLFQDESGLFDHVDAKLTMRGLRSIFDANQGERDSEK